MIDHDIALITDLADRLVALDQGRIIATGPPADVIDDPTVAAAFLGARPTTNQA